MVDSINNWLREITIVEWTIITCFFLLLGTTILAAVHRKRTVSSSIKHWGNDYTWFSFMFGSLMGHWFFPNLPGHVDEVQYLLLLFLLIGLGDYLHGKKIVVYPKWLRYSGLWFVLGIIAGMYLWGQRI